MREGNGMREIPKKRTKVRFGQTFLGVICENCKTGIALGGNLAVLPARFAVTCPRCHHKGTYHKVDIQTLEAHSLQ